MLQTVELKPDMKLHYPGLIAESLPSGATRWRVRRSGRPRSRLTLPVGPDSPDFHRHYVAARHGETLPVEKRVLDTPSDGTFGWLIGAHLEYLASQVEAKALDAKTLRKRRTLLTKLLPEHGQCAARAMKREDVRRIQDRLKRTPASADSTVEAIRVMYAWAIDFGHAPENPAIGVKAIDKGRGGSKPWTVADLYTFTKRYPKGTNAHVALSVMLFTGARVGDLCHLGVENEVKRDGVTFVEFQPKKKGSAFVSVPLLPQLREATRAPKVVGNTYVLTDRGKPFATPGSASASFKNWCVNAGLPHLSAHGVRKSLTHLLIELGVGEYAIMAILGHTQTKTTAVYTKEYRRRERAVEAMQKLGDFAW